MANLSTPQLYWQPSKAQIAQSNLTKFIKKVKDKYKLEITDYSSLYKWSIREPENFWSEVKDCVGMIGDNLSTPYIKTDPTLMAAKWFPDARINYSENLLQHSGSRTAITFWGEDQIKQSISFDNLRLRVSQIATFLKSIGLTSGDRVAGFVPNTIETLISMLAATSLGCVWSSCSPDFGVDSALDRFGQIEPKALICSKSYLHKGQIISSLSKGEEIAKRLPTLKALIVLPYAEPETILTKPTIPNVEVKTFEELCIGTPALNFTRVKFDAPLFVMFSSGTTGKPKCIVHSVGGTLLEHLKELILHTDLKPDDNIFYQTTCGWMMWNWLVSSLAVGASLVLYEGSPLVNDGKILWDLADSANISVFGTNAKYLSAIEKAGIKPKETHKLKKLRAILSTGSPLMPEQYDYVSTGIKDQIPLCSISGGTDIIGCFALGSPISPVYRGELQVRSLGLAVEIFDQNGKPVLNEQGELVCTQPFPSMPVGFWGDVDNAAYKRAYFERYPGIWHHGDFAQITENGGVIIFGRSDAVLNPGGIRIGTAEIYSQVEKCSEVLESLCVGHELDSDVKIILFVTLQSGEQLTPDLEAKIKNIIRANCSPFHVPWKIIQAPDLPKTKNGKLVELAVRDILAGREIKNRDALLNPEALDFFKKKLW